MNPFKNLLGTLPIVLAIALAGCGKKMPETGGPAPATTAVPESAAPTPGPSQGTIAFIPPAPENRYWQAIHSGAATAAQESGFTLDWMAPGADTAPARQAALVREAIAKKVKAIVLGPQDAAALAPPVEEAAAQNIPVVIVGGELKSGKPVSTIAVDAREAARIGVRRLAAAMDGMGNALAWQYGNGSEKARQKAEGFRAELGLAKYSKIKIIDVLTTGSAAGGTVLQTAEKLLARNTNLQGILCFDEESTQGMLQALEAAGRAGQVRLVGMGTSPELLEGLKKHAVLGLVTEDPFGMGALAIKTAADAIQGKKVEKRITTRLLMVVAENMDKPQIKEVIEPSLLTSN